MVTISEEHYKLFEKYVENVFPEHKDSCTMTKLYTADIVDLVKYESFFRGVNFMLLADHCDDLNLHFEDVEDVKSCIRLNVILSNVCSQLHHIAITQIYTIIDTELSN